MDTFDWLAVLFSFAIALYLVFSDATRDWPPPNLHPGDDEGRQG